MQLRLLFEQLSFCLRQRDLKWPWIDFGSCLCTRLVTITVLAACTVPKAVKMWGILCRTDNAACTGGSGVLRDFVELCFVILACLIRQLSWGIANENNARQTPR